MAASAATRTSWNHTASDVGLSPLSLLVGEVSESLDADVCAVGDPADHEEAKSIIEGFRKVDEANKK